MRPPGAPDALPHLKALRRDPPPAADAWDRAVALQAEGRCFEAYEHLAIVWRAAEVAEADRPLWRALAQVAAACCHIQRDNPTGARTILARAAGALEGYPTDHAAVDVDAVRRGVDRLRADLDAAREPRLPVLAWRGPP